MSDRRGRPRALRAPRRLVISTVAALAAVLTLVGTATALDVTALVFRSGSMSPGIPTGSLALARETPVAALHTGDVVSIRDPGTGGRVTHRLVRQDPAGQLILKGDRNATADATPYQATRVDRVFVTVPHLGRATLAVASPWGMAVIGLLLGGALLGSMAVGGRRGASAGRRARTGPAWRRPMIATALVGLVPLLLTAQRHEMTMASFNDTATVDSGTFSMAQGQSEYCRVVKDVNGVPVTQAGLTCAVTSVTCFGGWSSNGNMYTEARIYFTSNVNSPYVGDVYPIYGVNLANRGCVPPAITSPPATWSWTNAATLSQSNQMFPVSGYKCASLPYLEASSPRFVLNSGDSAYFQMVRDRTGQVSGTISCGL